MQSSITIKDGGKNIRLTIERIYLDDRIECFKVKGRNGEIVLESNHPLFRNKGLKYRRIDWKQVEGKELHYRIIEKIAEAIKTSISKA